MMSAGETNVLLEGKPYGKISTRALPHIADPDVPVQSTLIAALKLWLTYPPR